LYAKETEMSFT